MIHETHVCRDCGAEITIPLADRAGRSDAGLLDAVRAVITEGMDAPGVYEELHRAFYAVRDRAALASGEASPAPAPRPEDAALKLAGEVLEYHVPNQHTTKSGVATIETIPTDDGREIAICGGCGQEWPCETFTLATALRESNS